MDFLKILQHLLPDGRAWRSTVNKRLRQFLQGLADFLSAVKDYADELWADLMPASTSELAAWERQFGLPSTVSTDEGRRDRLQATWRQLSGGQSPRYLQDTLQAAGFDVYLHEWYLPTTTTDGPLVFTDLGQQFGGGPHGVACSGDGTSVYVVDIDSDSIYRSGDSGQTFTNLGAQFGVAPLAVACSDDSTIVYVVDNDSDSIYRSGDSGQTFTNLGPQFGTAVYDVACSGDGTIVYVVDNGSDSIYRSGDSGQTFTNLGPQFGGIPLAVACSGDGTIVYVTDTGSDSIYRSGDSGQTFTNLGAQFGGNPIGVACDGDGTIVYVTDNGSDSIYRSGDSGQTFTNLGAQFGDTFIGVACSGGGTIVYVVDYGAPSLYYGAPSQIPDPGGTRGGKVGDTGPDPRDPNDYINDGANPPEYFGCGHDVAMCGGDQAFSNSQDERPQGYLLVNKIPARGTAYVGSGNELAVCGGNSAASGVEVATLQRYVQYIIPDDVAKYPYFLYIGGETFPELATVPLSRKDEFEELCLRICPAQQWLGILVDYT